MNRWTQCNRAIGASLALLIGGGLLATLSVVEGVSPAPSAVPVSTVAVRWELLAPTNPSSVAPSAMVPLEPPLESEPPLQISESSSPPSLPQTSAPAQAPPPTARQAHTLPKPRPVPKPPLPPTAAAKPTEGHAPAAGIAASATSEGAPISAESALAAKAPDSFQGDGPSDLASEQRTAFSSQRATAPSAPLPIPLELLCDDRPPPSYPIAARRSGAEGVVTVRVYLHSDGTLLKSEIDEAHSSATHPALRSAAVEAVKRWRCRLPPQWKEPLEVVVLQPFRFQLQ